LISKFEANSKNTLAGLQELTHSFDILGRTTHEMAQTEVEGSPKKTDEVDFASMADAGEDSENKQSGVDEEREEQESEKLLTALEVDEKTKKDATHLNEATQKLAILFNQGQSEYNKLMHSMMADEIDEEAGAENKEGETKKQSPVSNDIPSLLKKIATLTRGQELSRLKAGAIEVQWIADRDKFRDEKRILERKLETSLIKLDVATGKTRFLEQVERDPNMVSNIISKSEFDEIERQLRDMSEEKAEIQKEMTETQAQFKALNTKVYEAERSQGEDKQKIMDLIKAADGFAKKEAKFDDLLQQERDSFAQKTSDLRDQCEEAKKKCIEMVELKEKAQVSARLS